MINLADMPSDTPGKTWREKNAVQPHGIPLGALVEITGFEDQEQNGVRLFVVRHTRDCDETPLYVLSHFTLAKVREYEAYSQIEEPSAEWFRIALAGALDGGYAEHNLTVIRLPKE